MSFWSQFPVGFTCLAPMEGVTDIAFRQVVARAARPDLFFTEFTNVNSYTSAEGRRNALARLRCEPAEQPLVAQIWGKTPAYFAETASALKALGYAAADINMGCPERHVVASGGGSGLIKNPALARAIIRATRSAGFAVSVKTRLGYSAVAEWRDWLGCLLEEHPDALTVHLRTKKEMSKVPAHHELIPEISALKNQLSPQTRLIVNGDILSRAEVAKFTALGADGIMIGRGVFQNPFCFEATPSVHRTAELIALMRYHLDLFDRYELRSYNALKKFFKIYVCHFAGATDLRSALMATQSTAEARACLTKFGF